ncbi:MAG: thiol-disulfide oxidoreductase DCC family protein [Flavobacteriaceae bacterium]|nr:MAG: thiol-disulfide oxidoreductase DCC family protein [Flavobacteriaceae bacterium]
MLLKGGEKIILFDGVCNLCNRAVQFIIKRDKKNLYKFAALQSDVATLLLKERGIDSSKIDSIILIDPNTAYYIKSSAALEIGKTFGGGWRLLGIFEWVPRPLRDWVYDLIAKNRYSWFGKQNECMIPTPELKAKFLD